MTFSLPITNTTRIFFFFFFNDTATTEIYTLSLHDALPIYRRSGFPEISQTVRRTMDRHQVITHPSLEQIFEADRKSTRLNSSHSQISYAVFCLKKKKYTKQAHTLQLHQKLHYDRLQPTHTV